MSYVLDFVLVVGVLAAGYVVVPHVWGWLKSKF
jgi:hypothetical protein